MQVKCTAESGALASARVLCRLPGMRLIDTHNIMATRSFRFGDVWRKEFDELSCFVLTIECPWRLKKEGRILVSYSDYFVPSKDGTSAEEARNGSSDNVQIEKLQALLGATNASVIVNSTSSFIIEDVRVNETGDFSLDMSGGYCLEVFSTSADQPEWILLLPGKGSMMWINGSARQVE